MTTPEKNMLVCSISKVNSKMRYFGATKIDDVSLLKVLLKYKDYVNESECPSCADECRIKLNKLFVELENNSPTICHIDPSYKYFPLVTEAKIDQVIK